MLELGCVHIELGAGRRRLHETVLHLGLSKCIVFLLLLYFYSVFTFTLTLFLSLAVNG